MSSRKRMSEFNLEEDEFPLYTEFIVLLLAGCLITLVFIAGDIRAIKDQVVPPDPTFIHKETAK